MLITRIIGLSIETANFVTEKQRVALKSSAIGLTREFRFDPHSHIPARLPRYQGHPASGKRRLSTRAQRFIGANIALAERRGGEPAGDAASTWGIIQRRGHSEAKETVKGEQNCITAAGHSFHSP
jgi:hypothetical protein